MHACTLRGPPAGLEPRSSQGTGAPSGRRWGSEVPVSRPRSWPSAAARLPAAAAGWPVPYSRVQERGVNCSPLPLLSFLDCLVRSSSPGRSSQDVLSILGGQKVFLRRCGLVHGWALESGKAGGIGADSSWYGGCSTHLRASSTCVLLAFRPSEPGRDT